MKILNWDNGKGPWGAPKSGRSTGQGGGRRKAAPSQQPDIEDVVRLAQERLKRRFGDGGGPTPDGKSFISLLAFALVGIWLFSGLYKVNPDEQGVVLRFGKYVQTTDEGLHWHLPAPIETVIKPKVTRENVIEIGFRGSRGGTAVNSFLRGQTSRFVNTNNSNVRDIMEESLMLTGDENIVDLDFTVRWKIADARNYLFSVDNVEDTIKNVAESAMREVVGRNPVDDVLTGDKSRIQAETKQLMTDVLNSYNAGVEVTGVELQQVNPPSQVIDAFRDVQAARADEERAVNQARGYSNDIIPRARGQVAQIMQEAEAYKASRIAQADGEAQRFTSQLVEYKKAPNVTRKRLYLEAMQEVVNSADTIILPDGQGGNVLPYLPLNELKKKGAK